VQQLEAGCGTHDPGVRSAPRRDESPVAERRSETLAACRKRPIDLIEQIGSLRKLGATFGEIRAQTLVESGSEPIHLGGIRRHVCHPMPMRIVVVCLFVTLSVGCDGGSAETCSGAKPITGVIVTVESRSLDDVRGFTLRSGGKECEISIDPERDYGFPLSHLNAHKVGADPVEVEVEERDGELIATSIADVTTEAPVGTPTDVTS
jgi:hypothetical protein